MKSVITPQQIQQDPTLATHAIQADVWAAVNRQHIKKCISELAHERVIKPELSSVAAELPWKQYRLASDIEGIEYVFNAQLMSLEHWYIDEASIEKRVNGEVVNLDSVQFIIEFSKSLNVDPDKLPTYMEEITSTLCGSAYKMTKDWLSAEELTQADFQQVEAAMSEGHPSFIANNGRIGFDCLDYRHYAPETGAAVSLIWIAAHKNRAEFSSSFDMDYETLFNSELDVTTRDTFDKVLTDKGLNPSDYLLMPVHPWQWFNKLSHVFAPDIAAQDIVCLGYGDDEYQAQQSIRTFFNLSNPGKHYVKTALSVLNMGFMRGLSSYYMRTTPAINDWLLKLVESDEYLQNKNFCILREIAAVGYRNPYYENEAIVDSPYKKMLAALWRESPVSMVQPGQRLMTMASLLHIDPEGGAVLPAMIKSSGLSIEEWMTHYFDVYLSPLLHCYFEHDLVYMPHGENLILLFENNIPVRAIMKDIGEEICLLNSDKELPEGVGRIKASMPVDIAILSIFTDMFDGFFRYLSQILYQHCDFSEVDFWRLVADNIKNYQKQHPQFSEKFEQHDLFMKEFKHSCLNRLQLGNNQQMIDLSDPAANLKFAGTLLNPIAQFSNDSKDTEQVVEAQLDEALV
ncbi:IucA/IucC family siderophore biosynthesis protein [Pleionea sp. CnH1-48]|nr:IucA/IucC family siderophore biosynthesis protein [Pleionea sp. CnH1-48]